ncbi:MAG: tRNA (guanosine(37)-N1)-methyltransferase TrmD [Nannocystaceae bacterium]
MTEESVAAPFRIDIVTLFPEAVEAFLGAGIMGRAIAEGRLVISCTNPRDFSSDVHRTVDDAPFGGGPGMVMKIEPVVAALEHIEAACEGGHRVLLSPSGQRFDQAAAQRLAGRRHLVLLCGRYEGIDDRVRERFCDECLSVGDFVLNGGEVAALAVVEAVGRLLDGVVQNPDSIAFESFSPERDTALEHPQYTRPSSFRGWGVPSPLSSGDHARVERWRAATSRIRTRRLRPELVSALSSGDPAVLPTVVIDARSGEGFDLDPARVRSLAEAAPGPVVLWTDRSLSTAPNLVIAPAEEGSLRGVRKILRGKRRSSLLVVPVLVGDEPCQAWSLEEPSDLLDVAHVHHGSNESAPQDRGIHAVLVLAPVGSPLRSGLQGGDPPSDFVLEVRGGARSAIDDDSGVENRSRVINPSQPQPGESTSDAVASQLQRFLERWTQDFHAT